MENKRWYVILLFTTIPQTVTKCKINRFFLNEICPMSHTKAVPNKKEELLWTAMQTSASNAPLSPVPITATPRTTALWTASWWVPTRIIPPWTSAPTVSPSGQSKRTELRRPVLPQFFLDGMVESLYDNRKMGESWGFSFKLPLNAVHSFDTCIG